MDGDDQDRVDYNGQQCLMIKNDNIICKIWEIFSC
jgi:hypothetical protein